MHGLPACCLRTPPTMPVETPTIQINGKSMALHSRSDTHPQEVAKILALCPSAFLEICDLEAHHNSMHFRRTFILKVKYLALKSN
jgi:hypothetical protein